jgi:PAS domain S-box-containing protein
MLPRPKMDGLLGAAFEYSPVAMLVVDGEGRVFIANGRTEELFGYGREEVIGEPVEKLVPDRLREAHRADRRDYFQAPAARPMGVGRDLWGLRKDGSEFPVEIGLHPVSTPDGEFVLSAIVDITERKRNLEDVRAAVAELARSNAELAQFAYAASHDLQEPLRMVTSYVQLLERRFEPQLDAESRKYMHYVVDGAQRMHSLIRDLLEYSRVGTGSEETRELDLNEIVQQALDNLRVAVAETRAEVVTGELPTIEGEPTQMIRLFQNLLGNAIKFRGEEPPRIRISARSAGSSWEIEVADNGIGIEPRFAERVFGVFQRVHSGDYPGTGIGLAICKKIVERQGGSIRVESEPNRGARFCMTLPRRRLRWR